MRDGRLSFTRWLAGRGLRPAIEDVAYFAHWITPEGLSRRFDTRFFLAVADSGAVAVPDQAEIVDCRWIAPADALAAHRRQNMQMGNATVKSLELLATFSRVEEAREQLGGREVVAIRPKLAPHGNGHRVVNPWEPGYDAL